MISFFEQVSRYPTFECYREIAHKDSLTQGPKGLLLSPGCGILTNIMSKQISLLVKRSISDS